MTGTIEQSELTRSGLASWARNTDVFTNAWLWLMVIHFGEASNNAEDSRLTAPARDMVLCTPGTCCNAHSSRSISICVCHASQPPGAVLTITANWSLDSP
ncbi:hypothetical protein D3C78_1123000 [compost metagenome]